MHSSRNKPIDYYDRLLNALVDRSNIDQVQHSNKLSRLLVVFV